MWTKAFAKDENGLANCGAGEDSKKKAGRFDRGERRADERREESEEGEEAPAPRGDSRPCPESALRQAASLSEKMAERGAAGRVLFFEGASSSLLPPRAPRSPSSFGV